MAGVGFCKIGDVGMKKFLISGLALTFLMACGKAVENTAGETQTKNYSWSLVTTWPKITQV
jgi:hypothetical protein